MKTFVIRLLRFFKNTVRVTAFLIIVAILLEIWVLWLRPKHYDGNLMMEAFYEQPRNSIDVLCVGSSHTFVDFNTALLWEDYGIPSFVIGGSLQPFWNSYYYIKEACSYQTPKLIILEALACNIEDEYSEHGIVVNNYSGMRWGMNKLEAIRASVSDTDGVIDHSLFFEEYHTRYTDLDINDIDLEMGDEVKTRNWKGFYDYFLTLPLPRPELEDDIDPLPITNKQEYYYRMIIEYCEQEQIPLMIMVSPDAGYNEVAKARYMYAADIAEEYGVDFVDFNSYYNEIGLDFNTDFADIGHLNHEGNRKFTAYLGDYIDEQFDLPDRRAESTDLYDSWEQNAAYIDSRYDNYILKTTEDLDEYIDRLNTLPDDYEIYIRISDITWIREQMSKFLGIYGIPFVRPYDEHLYVIRGGSTVVLDADDNGLFTERELGSHRFAANTSGFIFDGNDIVEPGRIGVIVVVLDTYNQCIADSTVIVSDEVHSDAY